MSNNIQKFSAKDNENPEGLVNFTEGDILCTCFDNKYHIYKLLVIDNDFECYHILAFQAVDKMPSLSEIDKLEVAVYHSPFDKMAFKDATIITNKAVKAIDLTGYHEYLRQTQEPNFYISVANGYYQTGLRLTDENKRPEAIDSYSKAIDLFPQFFEAIDNRAFCKMDLGLWADAIEDFKLSLQQNPNSMLAEFSIGECYFNLGDYKNAKRKFEIAEKLDPNHQAPKHFLIKINEILNR